MTENLKKYVKLVIPQKVMLYQKNDEKIQKEQNDLINWNTKVTIIIGSLAILAQVAEVLISWIK